MNYNVKLLDCTLRDGGFVNDWCFGNSTINTIFKRLDSANIDIIEIGFIDERRAFDENRSIQPTTDDFNKIFLNKKSRNAMIVGMIDFGTCSIENIQDSTESMLDGIRVIFKKENLNEALDFCQKIKQKGYNLFVQPVSITSYNDSEMLELVKRVNELSPYAFSIVDTYGLMHRENLFEYFRLIDANLNENICIGFHSHNNFQLAYSNSIELLFINTVRTIILDGSCYGMGKNAGNANTELLATFLNENCNKGYNLNYILEIIDNNIMPIYQKYKWGYSLNYFLSASNDCHPNYVKYLVNKKTLDIKSINILLSKIEEEHKLIYDEDYIEKCYMNFQKQIIDDTEVYNKFEEMWKGRKILILAPGKNLIIEKQRICHFIEKYNPIIVSVNFFTSEFDVNYIFISNLKRYGQLIDMGKSMKKGQKLILTSNIQEESLKADFKLNYNELINNIDGVVDTSVLMFLKFMIKISFKDVYIAGFDGFKEDGMKNYFETDFMFESDMKTYTLKNKAINSALSELKAINIHFITNTYYEIEE